MKVAIIGLCLLGVVAAVCAALLVKGLHPVVNVLPASSPTAQTQATAKVTVLYTARDIAAKTVIDGSLVRSRVMLPEQAPENYLSNSTDVVGKVSKQALPANQPYQASDFYDESGARLLPAVIPPGKRAVAISLSDSASLDGLVVPGSMVDVMVSLKAGGTGNSAHDSLTTTLLENIQVLAFDQHTVVSAEKSATDLDTGGHGGGMRRVTLLVDMRQAKILELGMDLGTLSLALRNPLDDSTPNREAISFRDLMGESPRSPTTAPAATTMTTSPAPPPVKPYWQVTVMKGDAVETQSFDLPSVPEGKRP